MTTRHLTILRIPLLVGTVALSVVPQTVKGQETQSPKPLVIAVDWTKEGTRDTVDGKPAQDLSRALADAIVKLGARHPVIVQLDDRVQVVQLFAIRGFLDMIGFTEPARYFLVHKESERMIEIVMHKWIPISSNPGKAGSQDSRLR